MTTNQPTRKRNLIEILYDIQSGKLTPEQAKAEIDETQSSNQESDKS